MVLKSMNLTMIGDNKNPSFLGSGFYLNALCGIFLLLGLVNFLYNSASVEAHQSGDGGPQHPSCDNQRHGNNQNNRRQHGEDEIKDIAL